MNRPLYVGLDVGGSTMKAGVVGDDGRPLAAVQLPTEPSRGQLLGLESMEEALRQAVGAAGVSWDRVAAIGVATAGLLDLSAGVLLDASNLRPWHDVPIRRHIEDVFGKPTALQNDANAAALGEYWAGAGRAAHSLVLFTLGTGIGGGIILDDRILTGAHGHAAELGHLRVELSRPRACPCGRHGCLEAYASALSVVQRTLEALARDDRPSSLRSLQPEQELTARAVFEAAAAGDALAGTLVEETAFYLAVGAANLMNVIDPDRVLFGGGMIAAGEPFLARIRHHVQALAFPIPAQRTLIAYAQLGPDAGFIGAAACARQLLSSSPRPLQGERGRG